MKNVGNVEYIRFDSLIINPEQKYYIYLFTNKDISVFRKNVNYFVNNVLNASEIKQWSNIRTRLVTDLNQLIEKMTIFQHSLNDKIIEIIKAGLIQKNIINAKNNEVLFDGFDKTNLTFVYYNNDKLDKVKIDFSFYNNLIEVSKNIQQQNENFALIDYNWVKEKVIL